MKRPLPLHTKGILSLVIAGQGIMARVGAACERHGITRPQYNVLRIQRGAGPSGHPRHEISARAVEKAPDITRILDRLANAGYVKRGRSSEDYRESVARITDKGLALLLEVDQTVSKEEAIDRELLEIQRMGHTYVALPAALSRRIAEKLGRSRDSFFDE